MAIPCEQHAKLNDLQQLMPVLMSSAREQCSPTLTTEVQAYLQQKTLTGPAAAAGVLPAKHHVGRVVPRQNGGRQPSCRIFLLKLR